MTETQDEYESKFEGWIDCKLPPKNIPRKVPPLPKFEDTKFSTNNKCRVCFNIAYLPDTSEKSKERKRLYCYCLAIHYNLLTKTYMRCIYHRKPSEFDEDHQHIYQIQCENNPYTRRDLIKQDRKLLYVVKFVVDTNMSINMAASGVLEDFARHVYSTFKGVINFQLKIPYRRDEIRDGIITLADLVAPKIHVELDKMGYYSITIDAASHGSRHGFFVMASNPAKMKNHIFIDTMIANGWNARDYNNFFECFTFPKDFLSAIVADGCPAQVKGLCHWRRCGALYPGLQTVYIRCVAHLLNLVVKHTADNCAAFAMQINYCKAISKELSKPDTRRALSMRVIHVPDHRWMFFWDLLKWIKEKHPKIYELFNMDDPPESVQILRDMGIDFKDGLPQWLLNFEEILLPIKKLLNYAESDVGCFCYIYPMFQSTIEQLTGIANRPELSSSSKRIADALIANMNEVFDKQGNYALMKFAFGLTPWGRSVIRAELNMHTEYKPDVSLFFQEPIPINAELEIPPRSYTPDHLDEVAEDQLDRNLDIEEPEIENEAIEGDGQVDAEDIAQDEEVEENEPRRRLGRNLGEWASLSMQEVEEYSFNDFMIEMLSRRAEAEARFYKRSSAKSIANEYKKALSNFIHMNESEIRNNTDLTCLDQRFWVACDANFKALKEIALKFMSIAATEADVERMISIVRNLRNRFNQNAREDLIKCRILLKLFMTNEILKKIFPDLTDL